MAIPKPWEKKPAEPEWKKNMKSPPGIGYVQQGTNGRTSPGRPFAIPDAQALLDAAEAYVAWAESNPIKKNRSQLHDGVPVHWTEDIKRPLTRMGFMAFLGISERTLYRMLDPAKRDEEFIATAEAVFKTFDSDLLEGGVTKVYDGALISRILQLADNVNTNVPPPLASAVDQDDVPNLVHPDDPDPYGENPLRFSKRQLDAGVPFPMKTIEAQADA